MDNVDWLSVPVAQLCVQCNVSWAVAGQVGQHKDQQVIHHLQHRLLCGLFGSQVGEKIKVIFLFVSVCHCIFLLLLY